MHGFHVVIGAAADIRVMRLSVLIIGPSRIYRLFAPQLKKCVRFLKILIDI